MRRCAVLILVGGLCLGACNKNRPASAEPEPASMEDLIRSTGVRLEPLPVERGCSEDSPLLVVTTQAILLGRTDPVGEPPRARRQPPIKLCDLDQGRVPAGLKRDGADGYLITPLYEALAAEARRAEQRSQHDPSYSFNGRYVLALDRELPLRTLSEIGFTAGQAEFAGAETLHWRQDHASSGSASSPSSMAPDHEPFACALIAIPRISGSSGPAPAADEPACPRDDAFDDLHAGDANTTDADARAALVKALSTPKRDGRPGISPALAAAIAAGPGAPSLLVAGDLSVGTPCEDGSAPARSGPPITAAQLGDPAFAKTLVARLDQLRLEHPDRDSLVLLVDEWLTLAQVSSLKDLAWHRPDGSQRFTSVSVEPARQ